MILGDIGSLAIMREQLDKLAGLVREPGVVIQALPFTARVQHQITGQSICQKGPRTAISSRRLVRPRLKKGSHPC